VSVRQKVLDARAGPAHVVEQHGIGVHAARRAIQEDDRGASADVGLQVAMVVAGGNDEQRVDPAPQQAPHELALALGVLLAGARDEHVPVSVRGVLHRPDDRRVERVGDVLDDEA
jgi:hypothetical protein